MTGICNWKLRKSLLTDVVPLHPIWVLDVCGCHPSAVFTERTQQKGFLVGQWHPTRCLRVSALLSLAGLLQGWFAQFLTLATSIVVNVPSWGYHVCPCAGTEQRDVHWADQFVGQITDLGGGKKKWRGENKVARHVLWAQGDGHAAPLCRWNGKGLLSPDLSHKKNKQEALVSLGTVICQFGSRLFWI